MRVVRVHMRERPRRSPLEAVVVAFPAAFRALLTPVFRLPPGARLRTAVIRSLVDRSYAALNRQDFDFVEACYLPDTALNFANDVGVDYDDRYEGRDLTFEVYRRWLEEWGFVRREPHGFVDRGDTVVILARERVRGESSGLEVDRELGAVFRLRGAGIAEQWEFFSWDEALAL